MAGRPLRRARENRARNNPASRRSAAYTLDQQLVLGALKRTLSLGGERVGDRIYVSGLLHTLVSMCTAMEDSRRLRSETRTGTTSPWSSIRPHLPPICLADDLYPNALLEVLTSLNIKYKAVPNSRLLLGGSEEYVILPGWTFPARYTPSGDDTRFATGREDTHPDRVSLRDIPYHEYSRFASTSEDYYRQPELKAAARRVRYGGKSDRKVPSFSGSSPVVEYGKKVGEEIENRLRQERKDREFCDNFRWADTTSPEEVLRYLQAQKEGCCGSVDVPVKVAGRKFMIGFNYGH